MYIQSNNNNYNYNVSMCGLKGHLKDFSNRIKSCILDVTPNHTFKSTPEGLNKKKNLEDWISRPHNNRLVMGATALLTQPFIDSHNPDVDEETRRVSRNRTFAKVIVGTSVGMLVRGGCYKLVSMMTNIKGNSKYSKALLPKKFLSELERNSSWLCNYKNAISMFIAMIVMLFTNFLIDAPLTMKATNKLNEFEQRKEARNG